MNLKEVSALLGWSVDSISDAILTGVSLPRSETVTKLAADERNGSYDVSDEDLDRFVSAFESQEPGRHPPVHVRRELRTEARHRCAICKEHLHLQYHHIIAWRELKHHDPNHMLAVCGGCHDKINMGQIDKNEQRTYKQRLVTELANVGPAEPPSHLPPVGDQYRPLYIAADDHAVEELAVTLLSLVWQYPARGGVYQSWAVKENLVLRGNLEGARSEPGLGIAMFSTQLAHRLFGDAADSRIEDCITWAKSKWRPWPPYFIMVANREGIDAVDKLVTDFRHTVSLGIIVAPRVRHKDLCEHYRKLVLNEQNPADYGWPKEEGGTKSVLFSAVYAVEFLDLCCGLPELEAAKLQDTRRARDNGIAWLIEAANSEPYWNSGIFVDNALFDRVFATAWILRRLAPCAHRDNNRWTEYLMNALGWIINCARSQRSHLGDTTQSFRLEARVAAAASIARCLPLDRVRADTVTDYLEDWRRRALVVLGSLPVRSMDLATALFLLDSLFESKQLAACVARVLREFPTDNDERLHHK